MPEHDRREKKRVDLVFEGGGVKGIGLVGAVSVLVERGYEPVNLAGASAGAIAAALLAAGYTPNELKETILGLDYRQFRDRGWEDRIPVIDRAASLFLDQGFYEGKTFHAWIGERLAKHGVTTFGDLVLEEFAEDPRYRHRLQVIASDVTGRRLLVLPRDADKLGFDPDRLSVALAVRMSMSIPIFFEPVRLVNPVDGEEHIVVDGGMLSNFPVWLFDSDGPPAWPTFGLLLVEPNPETSVAARLTRPDKGAHALVDYIKSLAQTMMEAHDRLYVEEANYARTIAIPTLGVGTTEFDLPRERALALYESGRRAAESFLSTWDLEAYVRAFRSGPHERSRRAEVHGEMRETAGAR
ncbi:MAG: patatin-like phospholipase family protein [Gaiellales bacterium]